MMTMKDKPKKKSVGHKLEEKLLQKQIGQVIRASNRLLCNISAVYALSLNIIIANFDFYFFRNIKTSVLHCDSTLFSSFLEEVDEGHIWKGIGTAMSKNA